MQLISFMTVGLGLSIRLLLLMLAAAEALSILSDSYNSVVGYLCIRTEFTETATGELTDIGCAIKRNQNPRCQAFTMADGLCQLFVFNKCSKSVRNCSCSRLGPVSVKQYPGLEPGSLCPSGYGYDLCGVKYKVTPNSAFWSPIRQQCEAESGLVIMADVIDMTEMSQVELIYAASNLVDTNLFLGGYQPAGSAEPRGGWYWVGCNITLDGSLWNSLEPDNYLGRENTIARISQRPKLCDIYESEIPLRGLCECVSPFN